MEVRMRTIGAVAAVFVLVGVVLFFFAGLHHPATTNGPAGQSGQASTAPTAPVAAGEMAANFTLKNLEGQEVSLSSFRGKVVLLNVWATWCPPCREEMPTLESLYQDFKGNKKFVMLAVSQDVKGRSAVAPFIKKHGYKFEVLLDPQNKVGDAYDVTGVPETFIIDGQGRIVAHHMGAFDWARPDVRKAITSLLNSSEG